MNENARRTDCRNGGVILCRIVSGLEAKLWIGDGNAGGVCLLICPVDESDFSAVYSNRKAPFCCGAFLFRKEKKL